jgi:hypothetical protein
MKTFPEAFKIGTPSIDETGILDLTLDGYRFFAGEKYTILEMGWAVYLAEDDVPEEWLR